jgi:hypothetical protein
MKKGFKMQFILWYSQTVAQAIIYGIKAYNDIPTTMIGIIGGVILTLVYAILWVYYEKNVPEGGFWITLDSAWYSIGDVIHVNNILMLSPYTIYKQKGNSYYLIPTE